MRKYDDNDERNIRTERLVREWTRSGLIEAAQRQRLLLDLAVDLRRTNAFLRLILFGFGILIITAFVLLVVVTLELRNEVAVGMVCVFAATGCLVLAEFLGDHFRLYRFGMEEAAAVGAAALAAVGSGFIASSLASSRPGEIPVLVGLIVGSLAALMVYVRFGYLYAAIGSMLCLGAVPFQLGISEIASRLTAAGLLVGVLAVVRYRRVAHGDEYPGDEYGVLQAAALAGIYAFLNLHLLPWFFRTAASLDPFYWFTYATIWVLPAVGLYVGGRHKDRPLLDVSLGMALATLMTNKPYLGAARQVWDPILFGILLIGTALVCRRYLAKGDRKGFTASRLLSSDKRSLSTLATASVAFHTGPVTSAAPPADTFEPGGGRSGGAGASGSF